MWLSYNVLILQQRDANFKELDFLEYMNQQFSQLSKMMVAGLCLILFDCVTCVLCIFIFLQGLSSWWPSLSSSMGR